ncbi:MAG TPA: transporter [Oleiagrimonas sp.]|nr:transporter [Oleiagrimonas sp.]
MRFIPSAPQRRSIALTLLALGLIGSAHAGNANPGYDRPGLGFAPAALQAGDFTWEQGLPDFSRNDDTTFYTADSLFRLGLGGAFELQLGTSWNHLSAPHYDASGMGSTSVGLKFAPHTSGAFSWGVLGSVAFTDGSREFGNADKQYLLGAAVNWQLDARNSVGAYVENNHADGRNDQLLAVNAGHALTPTVGGYVELGWQHLDSQRSGTMGGAGLTWMATPKVQLDASFRHRIGGEIDTWQGGLGVSVYFGHVL